ncbi:hypothetical protein [Cetobacterium ceti]
MKKLQNFKELEANLKYVKKLGYKIQVQLEGEDTLKIISKKIAPGNVELLNNLEVDSSEATLKIIKKAIFGRIKDILEE